MAVIAALNVLCLVGIFVLSNKIKQTAVEVNSGRVEKLKLEAQSSNVVTQSVVERTKSEAAKLRDLFPDDDKLLEFINKIDELKRQNIIVGFSSASDEVVKDKTGYPGVPVSLEVRGTEAELNNALKQINDLPVIINPIIVEVNKLEESKFSYKLGGFLYVDETFH